MHPWLRPVIIINTKAILTIYHIPLCVKVIKVSQIRESNLATEAIKKTKVKIIFLLKLIVTYH